MDASIRFALRECILLVTLQHYADFNWRVVTIIRSAPYNLFIIAKRAKDIKCPVRLAVCKELLSTADEKLHVIARKLKFVYKDQFVFCADNCGACRLELWLLVDLWWARYCPADTQSIEGFNHIVTNATVLAPNIKLPLLNVRCASRSFLSWNFGRQRLQPLFGEILRDEDLEAALQRDVDNHAGHTEVLAEFDRFATPLPSTPAQKARPDVIDPALQKTATHIWAAHYSSMWTKYHRGANAGLRCLLLIQPSDGGRVRVSTPASTHRESLEIGH